MRSEANREALMHLAAQACGWAIAKGRAEKNKPVGVLFLRLVVTGETVEEVDTKLEALGPQVKAFAKTLEPEGVVESITQAVTTGAIDVQESTLKQVQEVVGQFLAATGMPQEEQDEALQWATEAMSKIASERHDPMDIDEFLDMMVTDLNQTLP